MENFTAHNPTTIHFGKDVLGQLGLVINRYGKKVLLVYGQGSIKKNGLYNLILKQLNHIDADIYEFGGIKPNPVVEDVDKAASFGRENMVDVILAVGGGSVIDSAKAISIAIPANVPAWDFIERRTVPRSAIPLVSVMTLAATGSEMNPFAVLSNHEAELKLGYGHPLLFPKHSFLDPRLTFSVSANYTAFGMACIIGHGLEAYFGLGEEASLADRFTLSIISETVQFGPALLENLSDYELRAKIMLAAALALNGMTMYGRVSGEWGVRSIGHILSLLYDMPFGASLSIVYPAWLKFQRDKLGPRISLLGKNVFGTDDVDMTINRLEGFFKLLDCPVRIRQMMGNNADSNEIIRVMTRHHVNSNVHQLTHNDYSKIVELMF